jgi:hypothetical protein
MVQIYETALEHGYRASYFKQMVDEHGGLEAAHRLLAGSQSQSGLFRLWELDLLYASVEALVLQERFQPLFSEQELREARRRLEELNYSEE